MYQDRFGITKIIDEDYESLSISVDELPFEGKVGAILLYVPDLDNAGEHYHIPLGKDCVKILRDWCDEFLKSDHAKKFQEDLVKKNKPR